MHNPGKILASFEGEALLWLKSEHNYWQNNDLPNRLNVGGKNKPEQELARNLSFPEVSVFNYRSIQKHLH